MSKWSHKAMGTTFDFQVRSLATSTDFLESETAKIIEDLEESWTRFKNTSELSLLNQNKLVKNPSKSFLKIISSAFGAMNATNGWFDPRVHDTLIALGYDRSFREINAEISSSNDLRSTSPTTPRPTNPIYDIDDQILSYFGSALDLGGIGKGAALDVLTDFMGNNCNSSFLIDAGGDITTQIQDPDVEPWFIAVENPNSDEEIFILIRALSASIATSSTKIRNWKLNGITKHHLIDPFTQDTSKSDLAAVTVIANNSMWAEIYSKTLFLKGAIAGLTYANDRNIAALLIQHSGAIYYSDRFARYVEIVGSGQSSTPTAVHANLDKHALIHSIFT